MQKNAKCEWTLRANSHRAKTFFDVCRFFLCSFEYAPIDKGDNVDIFVLLKFENKFDIVFSHIQNCKFKVP